ncbi:MAG TPA: hypothetical protein VG346_02230 [Acidimicrobiales bacterium]|nr:hypothetical protein [Acidimicrobiales bacterium]
MTTAPGQATISVVTKVFPLAFLLYFFKTIVAVDGASQVLPWGEHAFPVAPGSHEVSVCFKYFFGPMGKATLSVPVAEGQTARVSYRSPLIVFMKGKITLLQA